LLTASSAGLIEDALHEEEAEEEGEEDGSEHGERLDESYVNELNEHGCKPHATTVSTATNTNIPPNASSQTVDDARNIVAAALTRAPNKTELIIDDSSICIMEQQQQQQQQQQHHHQQQRKLKYMPYVHQMQSQQQQQQQQRLSTPFASPSPSQQLELSTPSNAGLCFNGTVGNNDDDLVIFGQSIASQLRSIPDPYSRSVAKLRIQQVLFEAETGQSSEAVSPHLHNF